MNIRQFTFRVLGLASLASLVTSQVLAGSCETEIRDIPAVGDDHIFMTCRLNSGTTTDVNNAGGNQGAAKKIFANKNSGAAGQFAKAEGMNAAGVVLAGCSITDATANAIGQQITGGPCAAAVKWRGSLTFAG